MGAALLGASLGFALVAKYTTIYLVLIVPVVLLLQRHRLPQRRAFLGHVCLVAAVGCLVVHAAFLFQGSFVPLERYEFRSELFGSIQRLSGPAAALPVPLPAPWIEGLDWVRYNDRYGAWGEDVVVLGRHSGFAGFWYTYIVVLLSKFPIGFLVMMVLAGGVVARREPRSWLHGDEAPLVLPALMLFGALSLLTQAQLGVRHLLLVVPLLCVLTGAAAEDWAEVPVWRRRAIGLLGTWILVSTLSYHPHYICYFNEFVWDRTKAYRVLLDSNLNWNQNDGYVRQYLDDHPDARTQAPRPADGHYLIDTNLVGGLNGGLDTYRWLRTQHEPVGHVAYTHLIYRISGYGDQGETGQPK